MKEIALFSKIDIKNLLSGLYIYLNNIRKQDLDEIEIQQIQNIIELLKEKGLYGKQE